MRKTLIAIVAVLALMVGASTAEAGTVRMTTCINGGGFATTTPGPLQLSLAWGTFAPQLTEKFLGVQSVIYTVNGVSTTTATGDLTGWSAITPTHSGGREHGFTLRVTRPRSWRTLRRAIQSPSRSCSARPRRFLTTRRHTTDRANSSRPSPARSRLSSNRQNGHARLPPRPCGNSPYDMTPPSFAAFLHVGVYEGMRPGELDGLHWDRIDFQEERSSSTSSGTRRRASSRCRKHGVIRTIALTDPARERLLSLRRESEFAFHHAARLALIARRLVRTAGTVSAVQLAWGTLTFTRSPATTSAGTSGTCSDSTRETSPCTSVTRTDARLARERVREAFRHAPALPKPIRKAS